VKTRTSKFLEEQKTVPWFQKCGDPGNLSDCILVKTWSEAVRSADSKEWKAARLQMKNFYASAVVSSNYEESQTWNATMAEVRTALNDIYESSIMPRLPIDFRDSKIIRGVVTWDIGIAAMETEFEDTYRPIFYLPQLIPLYASGRFPCGREGVDASLSSVTSFPPGHLYVF
jgi:hypothetical protein